VQIDAVLSRPGCDDVSSSLMMQDDCSSRSLLLATEPTPHSVSDNLRCILVTVLTAAAA
jgi:hypothetical protein